MSAEPNPLPTTDCYGRWYYYGRMVPRQWPPLQGGICGWAEGVGHVVMQGVCLSKHPRTGVVVPTVACTLGRNAIGGWLNQVLSSVLYKPLCGFDPRLVLTVVRWLTGGRSDKVKYRRRRYLGLSVLPQRKSSS